MKRSSSQRDTANWVIFEHSWRPRSNSNKPKAKIRTSPSILGTQHTHRSSTIDSYNVESADLALMTHSDETMPDRINLPYPEISKAYRREDLRLPDNAASSQMPAKPGRVEESFQSTSFTTDPKSWSSSQRAIVFGGGSLVQFVSDGSVRITSVDTSGNESNPGPDAKPELLLPAQPVRAHPCPELNFGDILKNGRFAGDRNVINLGLISQVRKRRTCGLCKLVGQGFHGTSTVCRNVDFGCLLYLRKYDFATSNENLQTHQLEVFAAPLTTLAPFYDASAPHQDLVPVLHIHFLAPDSRSPTQVRGRRRGARADIALMRRWLSKCERHHGTRCDSLQLGGMHPPPSCLRVIDVHSRCVVEASPGCRYLALSYRWGAPHLQSFQATRARMSPNADESVLMALPESLPPTLEDALQLVKELGERYLWVDSLCIIQDDPDRLVQINQMDRIYGTAVATIVAAASEDVGAGLRGFRPASRPVQAKECIEGLEIAILPTLKYDSNSSLWASRAWTYQEQMLSTRMLFFSEHEISYRCNCSIWREDVILENEPDLAEGATPLEAEHDFLQRISLKHKFSLEIYPQSKLVTHDLAFKEYTNMVQEYTSRNMSQSSDILRAIIGVLHMLEKAFGGGKFFCGLPLASFHSSLLWQHASNPIRRPACNPENDSIVFMFPTWSWAGWIGQAKYDLDQSEPSQIRSKLVWQNDEAEIGSVPEISESTYYSTEDNSERSNETSIPYLTKSNNTPLGYEFGILQFWAQSAFFKLKDLDPKGWTGPEDMALSLFSALSDEAGFKRYIIIDEHNRSAGEISLSAQWVGNHPNSSLQFLAISQSKNSMERYVWLNDWGGPYQQMQLRNLSAASRSRFESDTIKSAPALPWSTFNVMLVERQDDGTYHRRGVGVIHIDAWRAAKPTWKFIGLA